MRIQIHKNALRNYVLLNPNYKKIGDGKFRKWEDIPEFLTFETDKEGFIQVNKI